MGLRMRVAGLVVTVGTAALCVSCSSPSGSVIASPAPDAEPAQVVQALVDAVNAGDAELVRNLSEDGSSQLDWWVEHGATMRDARIGAVYEDPESQADASGPEIVGVVVDFVPWGVDASMQEGVETSWAFQLVRQGGRWLFHGAGVG
ncbi:hypothetical protein FH969_11920 [Miniimonas arenae]|uniref:Nuclear transport factor 2 family protein n=1 Tax=Miniimonas arenae TaxID=676201 RepID=A0A5C5B908_9MICO|nr:hypothetical protein [Miniimonas arenae]TNU73330.1 hypothetical protein FH969_11920 [Miniimonas arenae]